LKKGGSWTNCIKSGRMKIVDYGIVVMLLLVILFKIEDAGHLKTLWLALVLFHAGIAIYGVIKDEK